MSKVKLCGVLNIGSFIALENVATSQIYDKYLLKQSSFCFCACRFYDIGGWNG